MTVMSAMRRKGLWRQQGNQLTCEGLKPVCLKLHSIMHADAKEDRKIFPGNRRQRFELAALRALEDVC